MLRTSAALVVLLGLPLHSPDPLAGQASGWSPDRLDELRDRIEAVRTERGVPSAQVAVVGPDTTVVLSFGTADLTTGAPVTEETLFRVGSTSKSLAAISVMMLVEEGHLSLDDRLRDLVPELDIRNPWYGTHPVRLAHLLEASAGFVGFHPEDYEEVPDPPRVPVRDVVEGWVRLDVQWRPGLYTSYHDRGPTLAAYLVEKQTGERYDRFVRDRILEPLGMERSGYFPDDAARADLADPPAALDPDEPAYDHYALWPSGSLSTSARELAGLVRMLLDRGAVGDTTLLAPGTVARIERSETTLAARAAGTTLGHGLNSMTTNYRGHIYHGHPGNTSNYTGAYGYSPESGTGFVFLSTVGESGTWMLWQGINEILGFLHPDATVPDSGPVADSVRTAVTGCYRRLNPWYRARPLDRVRVREDDGALTLVHQTSDRTAALEPAPEAPHFRVMDWKPERDEVTDVVIVPDEHGRLVLMMFNYPFEAYGRVACR